jgi:hypothetical protein
VFARLPASSHQRYEEEVKAGLHEKGTRRQGDKVRERQGDKVKGSKKQESKNGDPLTRAGGKRVWKLDGIGG